MVDGSALARKNRASGAHQFSWHQFQPPALAAIANRAELGARPAKLFDYGRDFFHRRRLDQKPYIWKRIHGGLDAIGADAGIDDSGYGCPVHAAKRFHHIDTVQIAGYGVIGDDQARRFSRASNKLAKASQSGPAEAETVMQWPRNSR